MTSVKAYDIAFDFHVNKKEFEIAAALYKLILKNFPTTTQARFADTKLDELRKKGIDIENLSQEATNTAERIFNDSHNNDPKEELLFKRPDLRKYKSWIDNGYDYFYEYKAISVFDQNGVANVDRLTETMNHMALQGWRLRTVVTNEVGKEAISIGIGGFGGGVNSTVDQTVLIFERKVKINIEE